MCVCQCVERQRPAIKPQSACFIFTVSKFINIDYILTIYNTFYTWRDLRTGICCSSPGNVPWVRRGKKSESGRREAKDCGGEGVRVSSPTQTRESLLGAGSWELGSLLAVRTKGLAPQSEKRGPEGKERRWDSWSSREALLYGGGENNKRREMRKKTRQ